MTPIENYLRELSEELRTPGRVRRRLLEEVGGHLADAKALYGDKEAVRRFGPVAALAEAFDTEVAAQRAIRATIGSIAGVLGIGASTLALLDAADPAASARPAWALVFFDGAQAAGVCAILAALLAMAMRRRPATPGDATLLCRRNFSALAFSATAFFAAAAGITGRASAWALLSGPIMAAVAMLYLVRARSLARKLCDGSERTVRPPLPDFLAIARRPGYAGSAHGESQFGKLLVPAVAVAFVTAWLWDHLDHGTVDSSFTAAAIEATFTLLGFLLLGPAVGLWSPRGNTSKDVAP